jgi:hypothetical protein
MQEAAAERETKTTPQVNHAVSYVALVGEVATSVGRPKQICLRDIARVETQVFGKTRQE